MLEIYQGEDKTFIVETNIDLTSHTEIELIIDTPTQIEKSLTAGQITGVTATQFSVQIDSGDTESVEAGPYLIQSRATDSSGLFTQGKFQPNKITVKDSAFFAIGSGNDYS